MRSKKVLKRKRKVLYCKIADNKVKLNHKPMQINLRIKKRSRMATVPNYAHPGDAGLDLFSCEKTLLKIGERKIIKTGIVIEIPAGFVGLIWGKSGLAVKQGLVVMGGVIDSTYRGEIGVILYNIAKTDYQIEIGDKIAQLLIQPVIRVNLEETSKLSKTKRGHSGFGSTGIKRKTNVKFKKRRS